MESSEEDISSNDNEQWPETRAQLLQEHYAARKAAHDSEHPTPDNPTFAGTFRVTAYCSCEKCCGKHAMNRPINEATGEEIVYGASGNILRAFPPSTPDAGVILPLHYIVSVAGPSMFDFGDYLIMDYDFDLPGEPRIIFKVEDRTAGWVQDDGTFKYPTIDVYMSDHSAALQWGVRTIKVYKVGKEDRN